MSDVEEFFDKGHDLSPPQSGGATQGPEVTPAPINLDIPGDVTSIGDGVSVGVADIMTQDEFAEFFLSVFPVSAGVLAMFEPPEFKTLVEAPTYPTAKPAAQSLYEICRDTSWLRFMLDPSTRWVKQALAIGAFGSQIAMGLRIEIAERREMRAEQERRAKAEKAEAA